MIEIQLSNYILYSKGKLKECRSYSSDPWKIIFIVNLGEFKCADSIKFVIKPSGCLWYIVTGD